MTAIDCRGVGHRFSTAAGGVSALEDVSLSVGAGEFVCIVGPSGCGKTTLLRLIAGLVQPTAGTLRFDPPAVPGEPRGAVVFQEHGLFPWKTVLQNVVFGLRMKGAERAEAEARARSLIATVGLAEFAQAYPQQLSVGMRQRVNLARAFLVEPQLLLLDEPFAALDAQTRRVLQQELLRRWSGIGSTVVFVTHDIQEAVLLADRILVMTGRPGRVRDEVTVSLARPREADAAAGREIASGIWSQLEGEVRRRLAAG